jgi:polyphosphate kinase
LDLLYKNDPLPIPGLSLEGSILQKISEKDYLLNAPYQSYSYLIKFLREAALDQRLLPLKLLCTA